MRGAPVATGPRLVARADGAADGRSVQPAGYAGMTCAGSPPCETVGGEGQVRTGRGRAGRVEGGRVRAGKGKDRTGQVRAGRGGEG